MQNERSGPGVDRTTLRKPPGRPSLLSAARARLWFSRAIKHSILQELLPTVVTKSLKKVTVWSGKNLRA